MHLEKTALRAQGRARRAEAGSFAAAAFAEHLATSGLTLAMRLRPDVVSAYFPLPNEPPTLPLLDPLSVAGFKTALPVTGKLGTPLMFRLWRTGQPTVKGKMAFEEPSGNA